MKIAINSGSIYKGGAEQVALSFIDECKKFTQHDYHVIVAPNLDVQIDKSSFPDNFEFYRIRKRPASGIISFIRMMVWYKRFEKNINPDCVISTGGHGFWIPRVALVGGFNIPHYIYTESPYFNTLSFKKRIYWSIMRIVHMYYYSRLDAVIVQTVDVKERLEKILASNSPVYVVSNTVNACFLANNNKVNILPNKEEGEIRLITVSSYYPHKNLEIIKPVARLLEKKGNSHFRFVVTLPQNKYDELFGDLHSGMIINVGPLPIRDCPSLYNECDFMFLPTLLECFSASYAEAMILKKPILTSDLGFAHTVCKDAAVYFNPMNAEEIADKIIWLSTNTQHQERIVKLGEKIIRSLNTPEERAKSFVNLCESITENES